MSAKSTIFARIICLANAVFSTLTVLTHIRLTFFLWDKGKQNSPKCDAAKRCGSSGAFLFAYMIFIEK